MDLVVPSGTADPNSVLPSWKNTKICDGATRAYFPWDINTAALVYWNFLSGAQAESGVSLTKRKPLEGAFGFELTLAVTQSLVKVNAPACRSIPARLKSLQAIQYPYMYIDRVLAFIGDSRSIWSNNGNRNVSWSHSSGVILRKNDQGRNSPSRLFSVSGAWQQSRAMNALTCSA